MEKFRQLSETIIPNIDEHEKLRMTIGLWTSWGTGLMVGIFTVLLWQNGFIVPTLIWGTWTLILLFVPVFSVRARRVPKWSSSLYILCALLAPFLVDYLLGGFARLGYPGFVTVVPAIAVIYQRPRVLFWTGVSTVMLTASVIIEPALVINPRLPVWMLQAWIAGSTIVSIWLVAFMLYYFVRQRDLALELLSAEKEKLRQMAIRDPLTGAHNRRHFFEEGEQVHQLSHRYQHTYAILMLDLDNFKRVNDTYGHAAGDEVLRETVRRLQSGIRNVDILARYGGEEFIVLMPETGLDKAFQAAERLLDGLRSRPIDIGEAQLTITASLGVAQSDPSLFQPFQQVVEHADQAAYRAKGLGKNCVVKAGEP